MSDPKLFISYSHDSVAHKEWVLQLATALRHRGVDTSLDQWDLRLGQDIAAFMQKGITAADRVLMICSDNYVDKSESGKGGAGYERLIVTAEVVDAIDTIKFIPLMRNCKLPRVPVFLGPRKYVDFRDDSFFDSGIEEICRDIFGLTASQKPALGSGMSRQVITADDGSSSSRQSDMGHSISLDSNWFDNQAATAVGGLERVGFSAGMEFRAAIQANLKKSQADILAAVQVSEIKTFGWPIALTLDRDGCRPRPYSDGVRAEIALEGEKTNSGRTSYDYWASRSDGSFYFLGSLFEDQRTERSIFFNTRIVRVTESILFLSRFYREIGAAPDAKVRLRITHSGLAGRTLKSSTHNRLLSMERSIAEDVVRSDIVIEIGKVPESLVHYVEELLSPFFALFDFFAFDRRIYEDIVRRFENGEVS